MSVFLCRSPIYFIDAETPSKANQPNDATCICKIVECLQDSRKSSAASGHQIIPSRSVPTLKGEKKKEKCSSHAMAGAPLLAQEAAVSI